MEFAELDKLREVVFERLVSGEDVEQLRGQLIRQISGEEAERLVAEACDRIERGRGSETFAHSVRKIRRRRLVGHRYLAWKILAGILIFLAALSVLGTILSGGAVAGSFGGLLVGGIIFALVEWQEHRLIQAGSEEDVSG